MFTQNVFRFIMFSIILMLGLFILFPDLFYIESRLDKNVLTKEEAEQRKKARDEQKIYEEQQIKQKFEECQARANSLSEEEIFSRFVKRSRLNPKKSPLFDFRSKSRCPLQKCTKNEECTIGYLINSFHCPGIWAPVNKKYLDEFYDQYLNNKGGGSICDGPRWSHPPKGTKHNSKDIVNCIRGVCRYKGKKQRNHNYCLNEERFADFSKKCLSGSASACEKALNLAYVVGEEDIELEKMACKLGKINWCYNLANTVHPYPLAKKWIKKSCVKGNLKACIDLGQIIWNSNKAQALKYFSRISIKDSAYHRRIENFLENMVAIDDHKNWITQSCEQGENSACRDLEKYDLLNWMKIALHNGCFRLPETKSF